MTHPSRDNDHLRDPLVLINKGILHFTHF